MYVPSLSLKVLSPARRAGLSGGSSIGKDSREMMTSAQYAPRVSSSPPSVIRNPPSACFSCPSQCHIALRSIKRKTCSPPTRAILNNDPYVVARCELCPWPPPKPPDEFCSGKKVEITLVCQHHNGQLPGILATRVQVGLTGDVWVSRPLPESTAPLNPSRQAKACLRLGQRRPMEIAIDSHAENQHGLLVSVQATRTR